MILNQAKIFFMQTIIDEILHESGPNANCSGGKCSCHNCRHQQEQQEMEMIRQDLQEFELNLEQEEEEELSRIFARAKQLLKKGYHKAKPYLVAFDIARRLVPGQPPSPVEIVSKDTAQFIERDKIRRREELLEQARQAQEARRKMSTQKPDKESTVMQELLTELEYSG